MAAMPSVRRASFEGVEGGGRRGRRRWPSWQNINVHLALCADNVQDQVRGSTSLGSREAGFPSSVSSDLRIALAWSFESRSMPVFRTVCLISSHRDFVGPQFCGCCRDVPVRV